MLIHQLLDMSKLEQQMRDGYVTSRAHPKLPLAILNYTHRATFDLGPEEWDENLHLCRGLIYHVQTYEIVSRPFRKFWNVNDTRIPGTCLDELPPELPEITTKLDGSLGIYYECDEEYGIATRGSFESEQAVWATNWYKSRWKEPLWIAGYTPMFEILMKENRIVVEYDREGLELLALINNETGEELGHRDLQWWGEKHHFPVVELHNKALVECAEENRPNEEGYVATWHHPGRSPTKLKIKFEDYRRLHRLLTGISPKEILRMLAEGESFEPITENAPEHYQAWVRDWRIYFEGKFDEIHQACIRGFDDRPIRDSEDDDRSYRKKCAAWFSSQANPSVLFAMLDGDEAKTKSTIWKALRPLAAGLGVFRPEEE